MNALLKFLIGRNYRLRAAGLENLPTGPCLLVGEHLSPFDVALVKLMLPGDFLVIANATYHKHWSRRFAKAVLVDAAAGPKCWENAVKAAREAVDAGRRVCVLIDAHLTVPGSIHALNLALTESTVPVHPFMIDGPWGNRFQRGPSDYVLPRRGKAGVSLTVGPAIPEKTQAIFGAAMRELEAEVWQARKQDLSPLPYSIVSRMREDKGRLAFADPVRGSVSRIKALTGAIAIGRAMRKHWGDQTRVGFMLPPSIGGALANLAAILGGRTVVNLNYTTGADGMGSAARQADLKSVVTSKTFLARGNLEPPTGVEAIYLEDVAKTIGTFSRLFALVVALWAPFGLLRKLVGKVADPSMDDVHAVIFSSGSTGEPKGIQVTHFNIISNIEGAARQLDLDSRDRVMHMLPFFHTFGNFLLWAGVHWGASLVFLPNPLDAEQVGEMTQGYAATILVATPTFMQIYMKRCSAAQFGSLRLVVAGAEKLPQPFALKFAEKFGVPISEGYGCTECSPVIAVNAPEYRRGGVMQSGACAGSVGRLLPAVRVRVVDPDSGEPVAAGEPGLLKVHGPNIMVGYLGQPEKTAEVLQDGWYTTGDIVRIDAEGFIHITDRLSRFSKIGGEMVPHGKVEEALHAVINAVEQIFAVTSIRDEKKGERLAVIHCQCEHEIEFVVKELQGNGLPNIFIPKPRDFVLVGALPVLGTGKLDLRALKRIAQERLS